VAPLGEISSAYGASVSPPIGNDPLATVVTGFSDEQEKPKHTVKKITKTVFILVID
jgi:hypothetical protein